MLKLTVLYNQPRNPEAFEKYYAETHLPLAAKLSGVEKFEATKMVGSADGAAPAFYRMAEIYFKDKEQMQAALGSAEGKAVIDDLGNFATSGVTILIGALDA